MNFDQIQSLDQEYVMQTYARHPVVIDHGQGATLWDTNWKKYIDFTSGIGVCSVGYNNEKWVEAITAQIKKLPHISNLFYTEPYARLAKILCQRSGMKRAFFGNSGAEANEGAIKLARKYSSDKYGKGRGTVLTLVNSFHGRTMTTLTATGQDHYHEYFYPFPEGFRYVPAGDLAALEAAWGDDVCAVMMEMIQGEGGVFPLEKEFVQGAAKLCKERDALLIIDEVQTGICRTGTFFAHQQFDVHPDVVTFAKGIAGGVPLGGMLAAESCADVLQAGQHGSTFGGNPIACAAALAVMDILDEDLMAQVRRKGDYIRKTVAGWNSPYVSGVRGMGLMIGIGIQGMTHKELCGTLLDRGLMTLTAGKDTLRLLPPLVITQEELDRGLEIMAGVLKG